MPPQQLRSVFLPHQAGDQCVGQKRQTGAESRMTDSKYNAELSAGSLLIPESRKVAELILQGADEGAWQRFIKVDNELQKRSPASARRQTRLLRNRLECISTNLLRIIVSGSNEAVMRVRFVVPLAQAISTQDVRGDTSAGAQDQLESRLESHLAAKVLLMLREEEAGKAQLAKRLGHKAVSGELHKQIKRLQTLEMIQMTLPEKPNSRLQKYRLTAKVHQLVLAEVQAVGGGTPR